MAAYRISQLAKAAGVGVETVRFYQRKNLLPEPLGGAAAQRGIRHYDETDVARLRFIRAAQQAGFTLAEIAELLRLDAMDDRQRARDMAGERVRALDAKIAGLVDARDALSRLAVECEKGSDGPCPILTAFETEAEPGKRLMR